MRCQGCAGQQFTKAGRDRDGRQIFSCSNCGYRQTARSASAFSGYRFPPDIIALAVRWYLRYRLSYADVAELPAERGVHVDPSTVYDWVQAVTPLYKEAARAYRHPARGTWAIDETYIKVGGVPMYVFRAIDEHGQVVDVFVSPTRDTAAAVAFLQGAVTETEVRPHTVTTDKAAISAPALAAVLPEAAHIAGKAEQQAIERDHQHLKGRYHSMRGFMRNLRDGFSRLGFVWHGPERPHRPRLQTGGHGHGTGHGDGRAAGGRGEGTSTGSGDDPIGRQPGAGRRRAADLGSPAA